MCSGCLWDKVGNLGGEEEAGDWEREDEGIDMGGTREEDSLGGFYWNGAATGLEGREVCIVARRGRGSVGGAL